MIAIERQAQNGSQIVMDRPAFTKSLTDIVGRRHVLTTARQTRRFRKGYRTGEGAAIAVVQPGSLVELWRVLELAVAADLAVILQAANTGLTGGSTPSEGYDRPVLIVNVMRLDTIHSVPGTTQVVAFPGSTLFDLEAMLEDDCRTPHSVIGSSCIGASVIGGICNNSGGALVQRGPAYTELALYAQVTPDGSLELVNELGAALSDDPEEALSQLEGGFDDLEFMPETEGWGSDRDYQDWVRKVEEPTPARYNADARRLKGASGCAGKLAVFAVRLDTFEKPAEETTFLLAANAPASLERVRQDILKTFKNLPVSGEYIHRDAIGIAEKYGRDTIYILSVLGTKFLPHLFKMKSWCDGWFERFGLPNAKLPDRLLQALSYLLPRPMPERLRRLAARHEHFLVLKMSDGGTDEVREYLETVCPAEPNLNFAECEPHEAARLFQIRFAAAGAAIRYEAIHHRKVEDILALDIALRRNDGDWFETLPDHMNDMILEKIYYGHFFCHVLHQDYLIKKGTDVKALKQEMLAILDSRGAEYPAEHNVGHTYLAKPALADHYRAIDPTNTLNPGIGALSKKKHYRP